MNDGKKQSMTDAQQKIQKVSYNERFCLLPDWNGVEYWGGEHSISSENYL